MTNKTFYLNSAFEAKSFKKGDKSLKIAGYANTITKDRAGDVVTAEAWAKGVENFRKNPVMLYQHKHDCPIGKIEKIVVDKKGIYVEGLVSNAAETNHGIQTLIRDGALKSFSVGFRVKDGKYNRNDDSMTITDVELLEISVVSIPCNQDSLFSVRKSFESDKDYEAFTNTFKEPEVAEKAISNFKAGITNMADGHYHTVEVDSLGNGVTTYASHMENHSHMIVRGILQETDGHTHEITMTGVPIHEMESDSDGANVRPLSPTEEEAMSKPKNTHDTDVEELDVSELEVVVKTDTVEKAKAIDAVVKEEAIIEEKAEAVTTEKKVEVAAAVAEEKTDEDDELFEAVDPDAVIPFINLLSTNSVDLQNGDLVNYEEKMYKVIKIATAQSPIFKFLEIDADGKACDNVLNVNAEELLQVSKNKQETANTNDTKEILNNTSEKPALETKQLHTDSTKENDTMADQVVESIDLTSINKGVSDTNKEVATSTVSEPRVAALVEKTGEAIQKRADAEDRGESASRETAELRELQMQISKSKDELNALTKSKMQYSENSRSSAAQFSEKEMANAVLLSKMLNKRDVYDTKYGSRMKAVTTVDQFLSNFSSNIYTEMEQQLVIAPMFNRLSVDARTFRVPVADEDSDGDVAMFKSGTFATGIGDTSNVPTSNQNTISSVEFTPHKFMATTHLAKDEEEDTILPLLDFLRAAATRRLARAMDKSILRGTGALTGFTASPTNAIGVGAGYASVIEGLTNLTADGSLEVATGSANDKADPSDIAAARALMGKYGLQLGNDLVYVTSIEGYNNLVTTSDFRTVDKFGPNATYLTGSVGAIYGIPIVISEFLDVAGTSGNHLGALVYKPGFMIAERRAIEIESEYEPRQQVTAMYMSTRFDFKALTTNSAAALDANKYSYAVTVKAG